MVLTDTASSSVYYEPVRMRLDAPYRVQSRHEAHGSPPHYSVERGVHRLDPFVYVAIGEYDSCVGVRGQKLVHKEDAWDICEGLGCDVAQHLGPEKGESSGLRHSP